MPAEHLRDVDPSLGLPWVIVFRAGNFPTPFVFPVPPQECVESLVARVTVHQTLADNFVDDFSGGRSMIARVHLRGTFGFHERFGGAGMQVAGSLHLRLFEAMLETFNALDRTVKAKTGAVQEYLDVGRLHFWRVVIERLTLRRHARDPLLSFYDLQLLRVQDYLNPVSPSLPVSVPFSRVPSLQQFFPVPA